MPVEASSRQPSLLQSSLASPAMARLLLHFVTHPDDLVHVRELRRLTGLGMGSLQAELRRLVRLGVLSSRRDANRGLYRLGDGHPPRRAVRDPLAAPAGPAGGP